MGMGPTITVGFYNDQGVWTPVSVNNPLPVPASAFPPAVVWPNASNTGYLGNEADLVPTSGRTINDSGVIIENERITDTLAINGANVTVRNCVILGGFFGIDASDTADGLIIEDTTFIGGDNCCVAVNAATDVTIQRCNISAGEDGIKIAATNGLVANNFIHDLQADVESHNDGIQVTGALGIVIEGNYIEGRDTSDIAMFEADGAYDNVIIRNNYLTGEESLAPGYSLYAGGINGTNIQVLNNTFGAWGFGPVTEWDASNTWSGNVRDAAHGGGEVLPV